MNLGKTQLFFGVLILLSYISIGIFGLSQLNHAGHSSEAPMANCPYATNSFSLCDNNLRHIENWHQFSNVILSSVFILFLTFGTIFYFFKHNFFDQEKYFHRWKYYLDNKNLYSYSKIITKWLSLFENSPSFSYARHS